MKWKFNESTHQKLPPYKEFQKKKRHKSCRFQAERLFLGQLKVEWGGGFLLGPSVYLPKTGGVLL